MAQSFNGVRAKVWIGSIVLSLCVFGGLAFMKYSQIQAAVREAVAYPDPSEPVELITVESARVADTVSVVGDLQAMQFVDLTVEVAGVIEKVGFKSGDVVREGRLQKLFERIPTCSAELHG